MLFTLCVHLKAFFIINRTVMPCVLFIYAVNLFVYT